MAPSFSEKQSILSYKRMRPFLFAFEGKTISKKNGTGYQRQPLPNAAT